MTLTLFNPSATDYARSADNVLKQIRSTGAKLALVRDSSKLAALCASPEVGMRVLFRAAGDDPKHNPIPANDPHGFVNSRVNAAPDATWIHGTNEIGFLEPNLDGYTRNLALACEARGKKLVAYNAATNQPMEHWRAAEPTIRWLVGRGHVIGVHLYLDGNPQHDAGGYAPLDWLKSIGARVLVTEYAYIRSIHDANVGYRAVMDAAAYMRWHDQHAAKMAAYGFPLFHFSLTHWNDDDAGKREGFGTEDHPEVDAHFAVLNQRYPIQEQPSVPIYPIGTSPQQMKVNQPAGVKLRAAPSTSGAQLTLLAKDTPVTLYADPVVSADGYFWQRVTAQGVQGWCANYIDGRPSFVSAGTIPAPTFRLISPLPNGVITARFNEPRDYGKHEGVDWALAPNPCAIGSVKAVASADGVVDSVRDFPTAKGLGKLLTGYGLYVRIKHVVGVDTWFTWYGHLSAALVCAGQTVKQGDPIGILGTSGNSTGYHVHLTVQHIGKGLSGYAIDDVVDPAPLLA